MAKPITVSELIAILQQADPAAPVYLEGCDCINPANQVWLADDDPRNHYRKSIMVGYGQPGDSFLTRGFTPLTRSADPPPPPNPNR